MHQVLDAAALIASEESAIKLPFPTFWVAIGFFAVFMVLMFVAMSFSGRSVVRGDAGPSELDPSEQEALAEYTSKHRRRARR